MNTTSFADPSSRGAGRVLRRWLEHQSPDSFDHDEGFDAIIVYAACATVAPATSLALIFFGTTGLGRALGWAMLGAGAAFAGWKVFQSRLVVGLRYRRHRRNGAIGEVPNALVAAWDEAVAEIPGFDKWDEYAQRRTAAFNSLLTEFGHLFGALFNECTCGATTRCGNLRHLTKQEKANGHAALARVVRATLTVDIEAFLAQLETNSELHGAQLRLAL